MDWAKHCGGVCRPWSKACSFQQQLNHEWNRRLMNEINHSENNSIWTISVGQKRKDSPLTLNLWIRILTKLQHVLTHIVRVNYKNANNYANNYNKLKIHYADMKIFLYVCVYIKTIPWKFRILNPKNSRVICPWSLEIS